MKFSIYFAAVTITLAALAACAPETPDYAAEAAAIKANSTIWFDHYNAGNADAVAALYADDALLMAPGARAVSGRSAIREFIAADIENTKAAGIVFEADPVTEGEASGDTAWISGSWSVLDADGATVTTGKYASIYKRGDGEWLIVRDIWNLDEPAPAEHDAQLAALDTLIEVWNTQEFDKLDAIADPAYTRRAPDQNADSLAELKAFIAQVHVTYPDFSITNDASAAGPGGAFLKWTVTATNTGQGAQPPTGNAIKVTGISNYQFADGKMISELVVFDTGALLAQLGATDMPHAAD